MKVKPTLSVAGSLAKMSVWQDKAPDLPASVRDYTGILFEPFAWYDRDSLSWKTWQRCLDGEWELYSETWPRSGTMRNGIAYRRLPLVPLISGIESGLLPTLTVNGNYNRKGASKTSGDGLAAALSRRFLPTLTARDFKSDSCSPQFRELRDSMTMGKTLPWVLGGLLNPTWCEWFMGFPEGWTELKLSVTRSFRKSRKRSDARS